MGSTRDQPGPSRGRRPVVAPAVAAALLAAAGCNQLFGLDPPAGDGGGDPDATGDGPDGTDTDGDGVADTIDNCPLIHNPNQGDDDRDGVGDRCDSCPTVAQLSGDNVDGDGLDDACDPAVGIRQCIAWFDGFDHDSRSSYLVPVASGTANYGTWIHQPNGDALIQDDAGATDALILTQTGFNRPWVETRGQVLTRLAADSDAGVEPVYQLGVWLHAVHVPPIALPDGCLVELDENTPTAGAWLRLGWADGGAKYQPVSTSHSRNLAVGRAFALGVTEDSGTMSVRSTLDSQTLGSNASVTCPPNGTQAGLRTGGLRARFDYLLVVDVDPVNCPATGTCTCPPPPEP